MVARGTPTHETGRRRKPQRFAEREVPIADPAPLPMSPEVGLAPSLPALTVALEEVRAAVLETVKIAGREPVVALLNRFGATSASTLAAEHWRAALDGLNAIQIEHRRRLDKAKAGYGLQMAQEVIDASRLPRDEVQALAPAIRFNGIAPTDAIEEMFAIQMMALHEATIDCARRARDAEFVEQRKDNIVLMAKTSRAFAGLVDVLDRHRRGGEQKVTVEHVHVHAGGQAIVGNVTGGGGGTQPKLEGQPDGA